MPETNNLAELYHDAKDAPDIEWGRIVYETPNEAGWNDIEGYITGELDGFITVVNEEKVRKVPGRRLIYEEYEVEL